MVEYFRELHRNHKNFLTPPLSTGLHTSKSRNNDESRKSAKITKIFNHENLELYGTYVGHGDKLEKLNHFTKMDTNFIEILILIAIIQKNGQWLK